MAAGFEESYIRLWSLKGESLNGMRSDFQVKRECKTRRCPHIAMTNNGCSNIGWEAEREERHAYAQADWA